MTDVAWSRDGNSLSYTLERVNGGGFSETLEVHIGDWDENDLERRPKIHDELVGDGGACSFSPDGNWILTTHRGKWLAESVVGNKCYPIPIDGEDLTW